MSNLSDPTEIRDPLPQPLFSVRRLVIVALLGVAAGFLVLAAQVGGDNGRTDNQTAILTFDPAPDSQVIRQSAVGVTLETGYDGRLALNGTEIPEDQMEGAIVPGTEAYERLTAEQRRLGPRPNNKEQVMFRPGPDRAFTELPPGEVEVTVRYWPISEGEQAAQTFTYTISTV